MIIATAGHVDHGKTRLVEALTGVDTDRTAEEKRRGLTIDLGFAYLDRPDGGSPLGFVDVPGHERFLKNMLAGVASIDLAMLVVAADQGPELQTWEHLSILQLLEIPRLVVVLTRTDLADPDRLRDARTGVAEMLATTPWATSPVFPVSALSGDGISTLRSHLLAIHPPPLAEAGAFRLAVDRGFSLTGAGQIATGAVAAGRVRVGDQLLLSPEGLPVRVRGLHAQGHEATEARAGERCALNLAGNALRKRPPQRGDWLVAPEAHISVQHIDTLLHILPGEEHPLVHWTPVHVHLGASDCTGRVATLERGAIAPGEQGLAQLVLNTPVNVRFGDRFIVRDQSARRTIGGGKVIDPFAPRRGRNKPWRLQQLDALASPDHAAALRGLLQRSASGVALEPFLQARNISLGERSELLSDVPMHRIADGEGTLAFSPDNWNSLLKRLLDTLDEWHRRHPDSAGPSQSALAAGIGLRVAAAAFEAALRELIVARSVTRRGFRLALHSHEPELAERDRKLLEHLSTLLRAAGLRPPITGELAELLELDKAALLERLEHYTQLGHLERVAANRYFLPETVDELARLARQLADSSADGTFSAAEYRDLTGIGRNLTIQVLEYLDRTGTTLFAGERRSLRQRSA